jgi:transcription termination factor Rho
MSVLDRGALEDSPLADLHMIASELSIDGYRRLRRAELIDAILEKQGGEPAAADDAADTKPKRASRSRRSAKAKAEEVAESGKQEEEEEKQEQATAEEAEEEAEPDDERTASRRRRGRRGGRGRGGARAEAAEAEPEVVEDEAEATEEPEDEGQPIEGVVELLANGSGFVRVSPPEPSDDDVYISAAQVKRCELVSGDQVAGPKRAPRRSERFASLIRVETINGRPASELADSTRFDDLPAAFPHERLAVGSEDPTLKAIEWLTPFGKGSRVTIVGEARSGKTEALMRLAAALAGREELTLQLVLAGVRPEEISAWAAGPVAPVAAVSFAASEDSQDSTIEPVIDQARRLAARGSDVVVLIDTLDGCSRQLARRALASARKLVDGGSLTVIATASEPIGGETTVVALDVELASVGRFPALDIFASGTLRPELLVGQAGADAIARTRIQASEIEHEER